MSILFGGGSEKKIGCHYIDRFLLLFILRLKLHNQYNNMSPKDESTAIIIIYNYEV